jgi:hypothetical protein
MNSIHEEERTGTFMIPRLILVRFKNISDKSFKGNQNTHLPSITSFAIRTFCSIGGNTGLQ